MKTTVQNRKRQTSQAKLTELARSLAETWDQWSVLDRKKLVVARRGGKLLAAAKDLVDHGEWIPWLRTNLPHIDVRTAQNWKRIWANWHTIEDRATANAKSISHLGMVEALELLRKSRPKREAAPEDPARGGGHREVRRSAEARSGDGGRNVIETAPSANSEHESAGRISERSGMAQMLEPTSGQDPAEEPPESARSPLCSYELLFAIYSTVQTRLRSAELIDGLEKGVLKLSITLAITDQDGTEVAQLGGFQWKVVD